VLLFRVIGKGVRSVRAFIKSTIAAMATMALAGCQTAHAP